MKNNRSDSCDESTHLNAATCEKPVEDGAHDAAVALEIGTNTNLSSMNSVEILKINDASASAIGHLNNKASLLSDKDMATEFTQQQEQQQQQQLENDQQQQLSAASSIKAKDLNCLEQQNAMENNRDNEAGNAVPAETIGRHHHHHHNNTPAVEAESTTLTTIQKETIQIDVKPEMIDDEITNKPMTTTTSSCSLPAIAVSASGSASASPSLSESASSASSFSSLAATAEAAHNKTEEPKPQAVTARVEQQQQQEEVNNSNASSSSGASSTSSSSSSSKFSTRNSTSSQITSLSMIIRSDEPFFIATTTIPNISQEYHNQLLDLTASATATAAAATSSSPSPSPSPSLITDLMPCDVQSSSAAT